MNNFIWSVNATDANPSDSHHFEVHAATVVVLVIPILVMMSLVAMYFQQRLATTNTAAPSLMALFRDSMDKKTHDADGTAALTKTTSSLMSGMKTRSSSSSSSNNKGSTRYHKHNNFHLPHPTEMDEALSPERGFHETIDIEDLQWDREPSHTNQVTNALSSSISVLHKSMSSISSSTTFQAWLTPSTSTSTSLPSDCSSTRSTAPSTPFNDECDSPTCESSETHCQATPNGKQSAWRLSWPSFTSKTKQATTGAMQSNASDDKPAYTVTLIPMASQPLGNEDFVTVYDDTVVVLRSTTSKPWISTTHRPRTASATATSTMSSSYMLQL